MSFKFNPLTGTFDIGGGGSAAVTALGDKYVRTTRFASIGSLTSGTITAPTNSEIVLDDFGGTVDAVVSQITSGKPNFQPATTSTGEIITTSFDTDGDWVLSGTPSSYPVAIIYRVRQTLTDFDSTSSDIIGNSTVETTTTNIQVFPSSGTWTMPTGAKLIKVYALGAGGGGGSGIKGAAASIRCGGGGGGAGAFVIGEFDASLLTSSVTITVGAGGAGGAGISTNFTNGNAGSAGGTSSFGTYLVAQGGNGGGGGTNGSGTGGASVLGAVTPWNFAALAGASASATGGNGSNASPSVSITPTGGGAGAGITSGDVFSTIAGNGGTIGSLITGISVTGGLAGGDASAKGGNGSSHELFPGFFVGTGGGGTRTLVGAVATGDGGDGGWGAGGGGTGSGLNSSTTATGTGGLGGQGAIMVITYL